MNQAQQTKSLFFMDRRYAHDGAIAPHFSCFYANYLVAVALDKDGGYVVGYFFV
jgi:hypothetical protein